MDASTHLLEAQRMATARLGEIHTQLEEIHVAELRRLALGEEQLDLQRRQLQAQDTQNLLAWMQLEQAQGREPDPHLVRIVRERLAL